MWQGGEVVVHLRDDPAKFLNGGGLEDEIEDGELLHQFFLVLRRHAAGEGDLQIRVEPLQVIERADLALHLVLGCLPHDAGVEDDDVRLGLRLRRAEAGVLEGGGHLVRFRDIHLAANRPDIVFLIGRSRPMRPFPASRPVPAPTSA